MKAALCRSFLSSLPSKTTTTSNRARLGCRPRALFHSRSVLKMAETLESHYTSHSADSYESAFFYEEGHYTQYLQRLVQDRLQVQAVVIGSSDNADSTSISGTISQRRILDIGGGTGNFTRMLLLDKENNNPVVNKNLQAVVVDPFLEHSSYSEEDNLKFVKARAQAFATSATPNDWWRLEDFHQVLMKEVVHHFSKEERLGIFQGMYTDLERSGGAGSSASSAAENTRTYPSVLIITRPQLEIDYPLWNEARQVWAQNQPSLQDITTDLQQAGFSDVSHTLEPYPCSISLERWQAMVQNRFWSTFQHFSDQELEDACETIAEDYKDRTDDSGAIHFEDRLLFISAFKK